MRECHGHQLRKHERCVIIFTMVSNQARSNCANISNCTNVQDEGMLWPPTAQSVSNTPCVITHWYAEPNQDTLRSSFEPPK
eukprot:1145125-Pelagomonas_calceolata.AAC.11